VRLRSAICGNAKRTRVICVVFVIVMLSIRANLLICSRGSEHGHLDRLGWT